MQGCVDLDVCLVLRSEPFLRVIHGPPGKQVCGVSAPEARLDVEHGHVSPAGGVVVRAGARVAAAGLVLDQLEEGLHVRPQPGDEAGPHRRHRLFVAGLQGLQQSAVVSAEAGRKCVSTASVPENAFSQELALYSHRTD